jgi:hypothetical protein
MPCKTKIEEYLEQKVYDYAYKGLSMRYEDAALFQREVNKQFNGDVVRFYLDQDMLNMDIKIPQKLIDYFYNNELRIETLEARRIQEADAKRAGVDYDDDYLFDEEVINPLAPSLAAYDEIKKMLGKKPDSFVAGQSKWILNSKGLYNLVDMNNNRSVFLRDMDMETGKLVTEQPEKDLSGPVDRKRLEKELKYFNSLVVTQKLDEILAENDIDVFDVLEALENVKTNKELDKIMSDVRKRLCR